ncbi:MAG TPA: SIS domain-containing protein [Phototrophicaceae bacterium]|nr:SIS domain-containing protein [Phototrophicaceae bacterium]
MPGDYTRSEILSQPQAWDKTLADLRAQAADLRSFFEHGQFDAIRLTGCGSTYYLSLAAGALLQETLDVEAQGVPGSELWLYPRTSAQAKRKTLLIAVSRSGATTETVRAVERFKAQNSGAVLTLSCYPGRDLTKLGDLNVILEAGQEDSIAQTRAYTVLYLATVALALIWSGQSLDSLATLPEACARLLTGQADLAKQMGTMPHLERFYFLGSGLRYGHAAEISLKMKEMSLSHSEPFHVLEFRHGPQSMVNADTLILGMLGEANQQAEQKVLDEMQARGAQVISLAERGSTIEFASGVPDALRNVLYLPFGQLLAFEHALYRGMNPDRPHNLTAVVSLDQ